MTVRPERSDAGSRQPDAERATADLDGVLVVDKPAGPTSHAVVAAARRVLGLTRVGHTGTLDPFATGVLPLVVGRATRLAQFISSRDKSYEAEIRLGAATDTYDLTGTPLEVDPSCRRDLGSGAARRELIERALDAFRGTFRQAPPAYSAKRIEGERAYALARRHQPVAPRPVDVTVHRLTLEEIVAPDRLRVRIDCGAGFYVRSLAHDLGVALGCGAHLIALRRTRSGDFSLDDAVTLETLPERAAARLVPLDRLLTALPAVVVTTAGATRVWHGRIIRPEDIRGDGRPAGGGAADGVWRVCSETGALLALAREAANAADGGGALHPFLVLR